MSIFEASILRVMKGDSVVGAAFLVSEHLVATCAHVVKSAGAGVGGKISLRLSDGNNIDAIVEPEFWRDAKAEDFSILRLKESVKNIQPLMLGLSLNTKGHNFSTYGFPRDGQELAGSGEIIGQATIDNKIVLQLRSPEVTPGFSGAPVFDDSTKRVVGMVVAITPPDKYQRQHTTAFAIPSEILLKICPEIRISDTCPYRSLDVFNEEDAQFFFGRERVTQKLIDSLKRQPRFLAVLGPSGSGKSSVVRSGLIHALKQGKLPGSKKWGIITIRPANQPFEQLNNAGFTNSQDGIAKSVYKWIKSHPQKTRLAIVIDQFEEALISTPAEILKKFISELQGLLDTSDTITIIITLRDDFYSLFLQKASSLVSWVERGLVNIPSTIDQDELYAVIVEPANVVGVRFEEGLENVIMHDSINIEGEKAGARSTILPLLEFTLTQLWENRQAGLLTHDAYRSIGGVTGGLIQWADKAYYKLNHNRRSIAKQIICELIYPGDESRKIPDTKQIRDFSDLVESKASIETLRYLVQSRLLSTDRDSKTNKVTVEIIHDALIREWDLLREWLIKDREFLSWREQLRISFRQWKNNGKNESALLSGLALSIAESWMQNYSNQLTPYEKKFIDRSAEFQNKQQVITELLNKLDYLPSTKEIYSEIANSLEIVLNDSSCSIYECNYNYEQRGDMLKLVYSNNDNLRADVAGFLESDYEVGQGLVGLSALTRLTMIINNNVNNSSNLIINLGAINPKKYRNLQSVS